MAEMSEQTDTVVTIDPHGDVKLVLDDGTVTVSRKALCLSSSVFLAMLGDDSQFSEASNKAVGKDQIRTITLKEDDFDATELIMKVIHHQNSTIPVQMSFQQLDAIAVICDKYDLRVCLIPWSYHWMQPYMKTTEKDGFESWLFISIVFRNEIAFTRITKHLILNSTLSSTGDLSSLNGIDLELGVPDEVIRK